jgi:spermidine synthase
MSFSFAFRLSSYFTDRLVYQSQSIHNKDLKVILRNGNCLLDSGRANYSFGSLHLAFQHVFFATKLKHKKPKNALILGFGAGSIAHILQKDLQFECPLTGVEIDKEVLNLARRYFNLEKINNCRVYEEDAFDFLKKNKPKFDLITVDIFQEINVPDPFQSAEFLLELKNHLSSDGSVYFNFVVDNSQQQVEFERVEKQFYGIYPEAKTYRIGESNRMLVRC